MYHMLGSSPACRCITLTLLALLGGISSCYAQSTAASSATVASDRTALVGSFATERLSVWQKRLNLKEWNISVVVSRATELKAKTVGNIHWDREKKTAVIRVLDPADYDMALEPMLKDIEFTVVHELIHLEMVPILSDLQRSAENRLEEEHAVNHLADALLKLDREK
jgi:hypothetical protein